MVHKEMEAQRGAGAYPRSASKGKPWPTSRGEGPSLPLETGCEGLTFPGKGQEGGQGSF